MSDRTERIAQLDEQIGRVRARLADLDEEEASVMDVGIKQLEKEKADLEALEEEENALTELERLQESGYGQLFRAVAHIFQYDHYYVETVEEFKLNRDALDVWMQSNGYEIEIRPHTPPID